MNTTTVQELLDTMDTAISKLQAEGVQPEDPLMSWLYTMRDGLNKMLADSQEPTT